MLTPQRVALGRIRNNAAFQYRAWKMAVDWVIALYVVVPGLIFLGYQYASWWREAPVWLEAVPYLLFRSYLFIAAVTGTIRYFVDDADQLFLIQRGSWFKRMIATGMTYSLVSQALGLALIGLVLFPLLRNGYGISGQETVFLFLITFLMKIYLMLGKQQLELRLSGWKSIIVRALLMPVLAAVFGVLSSGAGRGLLFASLIAACLFLPLCWLLPARLRAKGTFYRDVIREREEKMKLASMLMSAGGFPARKKSKPNRKHPFLFPASRKLFKQRTQENVLAESLIKAILRSTSKLRLVALASLAYCTAISVCPASGIRTIVLIIVSALFAWMAKAFAKEAATEAYVQLFPWKDEVRMEAFWKTGAALTIPASALFALVAGIWDGGPVSGLLMLPVGAALGWFIARMFGMSGLQPKRAAQNAE
ncbi:MAG: hypothetical protein K0R57_1556 [Paenibacillaceae bacterium]|jgi:predicted ABC-type exoprotein transport system permease subunit|nr:hypothetical protein [Paenibacillaceae bacterium]